MAPIVTKFRLLLAIALVIAATSACDDQLEGGANSNRVECPLGQNCDGGAGQGGVVAQGESGIEDTATSGNTEVAGSGGVSTGGGDADAALTASDSGIEASVDAAIEVGPAESGAIDAPVVGDETPLGIESSVDSSDTQGNSEPCESGRVNGAEAQALVAQGALLLDVRTPAEFAADAIAGAINIPLDELTVRFDELSTDRTIITYCRSGNRSAQAAQLLRDQGFVVCDLGPRSAWDG